ncbi:class I SAM-dependent methyltransferase [Mariprofundus sp. KV]|uniref:O-methyltransferase n=1 Tax=Mariprofundus sp. KV TaxID=2608715 RepID=UPI0015A2B21E|nr:class I SAM-dependent methyltransferase [Mariprofundus sp. KV]NWF37444.1 methyltransferase domain-containing protein [Mariprofundus sp. KV]
MANQTIHMDEQLYSYLLEMGLREPEVLQRLREATEAEEMSVMRSAPEQGQLMAMLIRLTGARRVIEVGTYTGYATLWMALSLPDDGKIITCDISERWSAVARDFWKQAGVQERVSLHLRPALQTLDELLECNEAECFDFAFIDADKESYQQYFERCLQLIRPGGLIVIDNVLWGGSVIDETKLDSATEAIRAFNHKLKGDPRIDLVMLPVADGMTLALKR